MIKNSLLIWGIILIIMPVFVLPSTIRPTDGIIIEKYATTTSDIAGLYYLRDDDIIRSGNKNDKGTLRKLPPQLTETTFCDQFIVFHFGESGFNNGIYQINNIYFHIWQHEPDTWSQNLFYLGYSTTFTHDPHMNESITINTDYNICTCGHYRLIQKTLITNPNISVFNGRDIYNFSIKVTGCGPKIRTSPSHQSFVILNAEDNETLQTLDRDDDYLNDYDEFYIYFTNPLASDTDNDGATDYEEVFGGDYGYWNSNPNMCTNTTYFRLLIANAGGPYKGQTGQPIQFSGSVTGNGFLPYYWYWDFGDGNTSEGQNPIHSYSKPEVYKVSLGVTDNLWWLKPNEATDITTATIISSKS